MSEQAIIETVLSFYPEVQAIYLFGTYLTPDAHRLQRAVRFCNRTARYSTPTELYRQPDDHPRFFARH